MATMTAAQRRARAKVQYDAFVATCPTRQLLATISDKWTGLLLVALADGPVRYNQLAARVAGISQKMLTQTLRTLEREGLVSRTVTVQVPVRVDYELTDLGRSLMPVMLAVKQWAEEHMEQVHEARGRYDATSGSAASS